MACSALDVLVVMACSAGDALVVMACSAGALLSTDQKQLFAYLGQVPNQLAGGAAAGRLHLRHEGFVQGGSGLG